MAIDLQTTQAPSTASLVGGIVSDFQDLLKRQVDLFRVEMRQTLERERRALPLTLVGLGASFLGLILLGFALVYLFAGLVPNLPLWAWFAIVGGVLTSGGTILVWSVFERYRPLNPLPEQTIETLKENVEWKTNRS